MCGEIGLSLSLNVWIWFVFESVMLCVIIEDKDGLNLIEFDHLSKQLQHKF